MAILSDITDDYDPHRDHDLVVLTVEVRAVPIDLVYTSDEIKPVLIEDAAVTEDWLDVHVHGTIECRTCGIELTGVTSPLK